MKKTEKKELAIKLLEEKGISKRDFAELTGMSERTYDRLFEDKGNPTDSTLIRLSDALNVHKSYWNNGIITEKKISINEGAELNWSDESSWKEEAYNNLKEQRDYFKSRYDLLFEMMVMGRKPEEVRNFSATSKEAGFELNANPLEVAA